MHPTLVEDFSALMEAVETAEMAGSAEPPQQDRSNIPPLYPSISGGHAGAAPSRFSHCIR
jgi:hypothetical protein